MQEINAAKDFLGKNFNIIRPTQNRLEKMVRIVISNNGSHTLDELCQEARIVLGKLGYYKPTDDRIINMMHDIAIKNGSFDADNFVGTEGA